MFLVGFSFTVEVRVYLVKSGITYKVSTVRCTFNKKSDMFYRHMSYMKYPAVQNVYIDPMATTHIGL